MQEITQSKIVGNKDYFFEQFDLIAHLYEKQTLGIQQIIRSVHIGNRNLILNEMCDNHFAIKQYNLNIFHQLAGNFFPPIDREDIISISISYRTLSKKIYDLARRVVIYKLDILNSDIDNLISEFVQIGYKYKLLVDMCKDFSKANLIIDLLISLDKIISKLNTQLEDYVSFLLEHNKDVKLVLKEKEFYQGLQMILNIQLQSVQEIEGMVVKYA